MRGKLGTIQCSIAGLARQLAGIGSATRAPDHRAPASPGRGNGLSAGRGVRRAAPPAGARPTRRARSRRAAGGTSPSGRRPGLRRPADDRGGGVTFFALLAIFPALAALDLGLWPGRRPRDRLGPARGAVGHRAGRRDGHPRRQVKHTHLRAARGARPRRVIRLRPRCGAPTAASRRCSTRSTSSMMSRRSGAFLRTAVAGVHAGRLLFVMLAMVGSWSPADRAEFRRAWQGTRHAAARGALAAAAGRRRACCSPSSIVTGRAGTRRVALGELGRSLRGGRLGARLARFLLVRRQFRQLQQDLRLARRGDRLHDLDLDLDDHRAGRRAS